jgi:hypothetical protein
MNLGAAAGDAFFRNDEADAESVQRFRSVPPKVSDRKKTSLVGGSGSTQRWSRLTICGFRRHTVNQ